ncbi:hypothetical protein [Alsobacter metallidurans]|nr:hypothetical protein [Alsobacter metallidurans]
MNTLSDDWLSNELEHVDDEFEKWNEALKNSFSSIVEDDEDS